MTTSTTYLGLPLAHPFILGASPLTGSLDHVRRAEDGGCAAVVMHSLFEEDVAVAARSGPLARVAESLAETRSHFPSAAAGAQAPGQYLEQLRRVKGAVSVPVIASLNGTSAGGWLSYARLMEEAGADALELNVYTFPTGVHESPTAIEAGLEMLVRRVRSVTRLPLAVKLPPFFTSFGHLAMRLEGAGADGLVLFNRFYQPDVDVETLQPLPNLHLSTSAELLLRLRWLDILSRHMKGSLAATGGILQVVDGIKAILSGAHAVQLVSAVLQQGPQRFREMADGLRAWMTRHDYASIHACRGQLHVLRAGSGVELERTGYARVLKTWSGGAG